MNLDQQILKLTSTLYGNLRLGRSDIQFILESFQNFVKDDYNPFLLKKLNENLYNAVDEEVAKEITVTFDKYRDPFKKFDSEDKRLRLYKKLGLYVEPESCVIEKAEVPKSRGNKLIIKDTSVSYVHLPMKHSLKKLLEVDGLFDAIIAYMSFLEREKNIIINFVQGELWKKLRSSFDKHDGVVLPLFGSFDDVETGNALGSHAGINEVGVVNAIIPCIPPSYASKLESIIVCDIFYSKDRKLYGNDPIFEKFIEESNELSTCGIEITVNNKRRKVYFITSLILGDNLGLNSSCGFVESFHNTHCCRVCYADAELISTMTKEDESLLRTVEKYEEDIKNIDPSKTGIKSECVFNKLILFHIILNWCLDIMHDAFEGFCNYATTQIILKLIEEKCFTMEYLNYQIRNMDFDFESSNIPPQLCLDYMKKNSRMKTSSSETLFLTRYLGVIIGEEVMHGNKYWEVYKKLRSVINIASAYQYNHSIIAKLGTLVTDFLESYERDIGHFTLKFHNMLHAERNIENNGPLMKTSCLRTESKHRHIKMILQASSSNVNILKSIGIRYELSLMNYNFSKYQDQYVTYGSSVKDDSLANIFPGAKNKISVNYVIVNSFQYSKNSVIVTEIDETEIEYGKIEKIYVVDGSIKFLYEPFAMIGFNSHYYAYSVKKSESEKRIIDFDSLPSKTPCLMFIREKTCFVVHRHIL